MARITFLLPNLTLNGGVRVVAQYCAHLIEQGHQVQVIARTPALPRVRDLARRGIAALQMPPMRRDFFDGLQDRVTIVPSWRSLRASDLPDADFLIATWWETVEWASDMPASKGVQVHLMQHYEMFPFLDPVRVAATYERPMIRIAVSNWIAQQVYEHHAQPTQAVIPNAVDTCHFAFMPERNNQVLTLGFQYSAPDFKNMPLVFDVKRELERHGMMTRFLCLSSEDDLALVTAHDNITLHCCPPQALIPSVYQACDLWLFTSLEEGFGLPILEAMACGTPVVASRAGAAPDLIRDGVNGYLCDWTAADFVTAIRRFGALAPDQKRAMRHAACAGAQSQTWGAATAQLVAVLQARTARGVDATQA